MTFSASFSVDHPHRAAEALAALQGGAHRARTQPDGSWAVAPAGERQAPVLFRPRAGTLPDRTLCLDVSTPHSVERVIELACAHGFHAEETDQFIEFWIDEDLLLKVWHVTAEPFPLAA
jgi:hypothetical protein